MNPYYVATNYQQDVEVSKHYYMGAQRVASAMIGFPFIEEDGQTTTDPGLEEPTPDGDGGESGPNPAGYQFLPLTMESSSGTSTLGVVENMKDLLNHFGYVEGTDYVVSDMLQMRDYSGFSMSQGDYNTAAGDCGTPECYCEQSVYWAHQQEDASCDEIYVMYWYHPDYLGNTEFITDRSGDRYQNFFYTPWGESLVSQHSASASYSSAYRFNAKEYDTETGNYYYGARYYDPKVSVWLSVDPLAHKYPHVTPYNFVENNPVMLVDPTGLGPEVVINGAEAEKATQELNANSDLNITRDQETGKLSATGEATTEADKQLLAAIESTEYVVEVNAVEDDVIEVVGQKYRLDGGGFMGGFKEGKDGKPTAIQNVNTKHMKNIEKAGGNKAGVGIMHEVLEAWSGVQRENLEFIGNARGSGNINSWFDNLYLPSHNQAIEWDPRFKPSESPKAYQRVINGKTIDVRTGNQIR